MIKKMGFRRFLRLSWKVFRKKYFPRHDTKDTDPRSEMAIERDRSTGAHLVLALLLGTIFTVEPLTLALLFGFMTSDATIFVWSSVACGVILLAIPIGTAVQMMYQLNKHGEKILDDIILKY